ncbi:xanthine phosphoribosyltransferase [Paenibacillus sp. N1-5-1-14]|uniref:xanthine phosphoribosyltransferase n=1 Tax=Paenibacillus radicibacter TaxID=2972488 RepID=UPI00215970A6|nr:xanthine phosphoribosyltransferase [Paenibacillus radicibacter]MCR8643922.1 xanthine phosphoribosyltransferase [Paenibacillus radicibacter]
MDLLKKRIEEVGDVVSDGVLRLDSILNHQVDPDLIMAMGREFAVRFKSSNPTKVVTVESSGIPIAFATALELGVPLIFARRKKSVTISEHVYEERVPSFTKGIVTDIVIAQKYLNEEDRVLIIDDFIANGDAARGLVRIVEKSGAELVGIGIAVEKSFQNGGHSLRELGIKVESLAKIASLTDGKIVFES